MKTPLLHIDAEEQLARLVARPPHAVLIVAPNGAGKGTIARYIACQLLQVDTAKLASSAYFRELSSKPGKMISIEDIRAVTHFLTLKSTNRTRTSRVVLIEHAGDMTPQAQNALLKTIEEPPTDTVLILTAANELDVLPTIRSRVQLISLRLPAGSELRGYLRESGYGQSEVDKALLMSDGLPGLTRALLDNDTAHPLVAAADRARELLQKSPFERLIMIDELTKDKQSWLDMLFIVQRMAQISLQKPNSSDVSTRKWHAVLSAAHIATNQTLASAQIKLVGLEFMLSF